MTAEEFVIDLLTTGQRLVPEAAARVVAEVKAAHAHGLAEKIREDVDLDTHSGEAVYPCEDCIWVRDANMIDPEVAP